MSIYWSDILAHPLAALAIVGNLVIIESLLSVDNAAVLATLVMDLPEKDRSRALKYGILGAYIFRGVALLFAAVLIKIWFLQPLGGLYLLYLVYDWYRGKQTEDKSDDYVDKQGNWFYRATLGALGNFWATVCLVEIIDMTFSIDNVFAVVAFTPNIIMVFVGVFIGILAMRFIAQWFVTLMERYSFLETSAFVVIAILGVKLLMTTFSHFYPGSAMSHLLESSAVNFGFSVLTVLIFFVPIITSVLFNFPKRIVKAEKD